MAHVRIQLSQLLERDTVVLRDDAALRQRALVRAADATLHLPVQIPGYTDFYSSKEHATNVGSMFRDPKNALLPNWSEMPIGYNGRASSVVVSGTPVRRPNGQIKLPDQERPVFSACRKLDIELETGFIVGAATRWASRLHATMPRAYLRHGAAQRLERARHPAMGIRAARAVQCEEFRDHDFAVDRHARCARTVSHRARRSRNRSRSRICATTGDHAFDIELEVHAASRMRGQAATTISRTNFKLMYWSMAQQLAHHTVAGCNTRVGDLMGSGTISGPTPDSCGSLLEMTWNGTRPIKLEEGGERTFIEDGDELTLAGWCQGEGYRVGFGQCAGRILAARGAGSAG